MLVKKRFFVNEVLIKNNLHIKDFSLTACPDKTNVPKHNVSGHTVSLHICFKLYPIFTFHRVKDNFATRRGKLGRVLRPLGHGCSNWPFYEIMEG